MRGRRDEVLLEPRGFLLRLYAPGLVDERAALEHDRGLVGEELREREVVGREDRLVRRERLEDADPAVAGGDRRDEHGADVRRPVGARVLGVCARRVGEELRPL